MLALKTFSTLFFLLWSLNAMSQPTPIRYKLPPGWNSRFRPQPLKPVGKIIIRNVPYKDHSANASLSQPQVLLGDYFNLSVRSLFFQGPGTLKVYLQDAVNQPTGLGVLGFQLRNVFPRGQTLQIQAPWHQIFKGRTFHVTVFLYTGQENHYAYAGKITFQ